MTELQPPKSLGRKRNSSRAAIFASFDALEICRIERVKSEIPSDNDPHPEEYRGYEYDESIQ